MLPDRNDDEFLCESRQHYAPGPRLKEGDRVRLAAFEDQPEQTGTIEDVDYASGTVCVQLDEEYFDRLPDNGFDDGLRECGIEQVKEVL